MSVQPSPSQSPLDSLFAPRSIAVLGASSRAGRPGFQVLEALGRFDAAKPVYPITPRYEEILGRPCFADISLAPVADLGIIACASDRIESEVDAAIAHGVSSLLIFGAPKADANRQQWLRRIGDKARAAGVTLLGPDTLGYVNYAKACGATWAITDQTEPGGIAVVSQSGTVFWEAITNDPRLRFSFSGHSGLESTLTMADLIDYALTLEATRVIGLYVETIRDGEGFPRSLATAAEMGIPVVALYAGRTEKSRFQMMTHAGRLAGDRSSLEGLLRRHGVARVESPDEWWTTLALLGSNRSLAPGGLAAVMDSGGGLAMYLDYAEELGVPLAALSDGTKGELATILGYDGEIDSALDFWIGDADRHSRTEDLLTTLAADDGTAAVLAFTTYGESPSAGFAQAVADACLGAAAQTVKPIIPATYTSRQVHPELMMRITEAGLPILDGMRTALVAFAHAFRYRTFRENRSVGSSEMDYREPFDPAGIQAWTTRMAGAVELGEADALEFLMDFGVPCVPTIRAENVNDALDAADQVGYPVVLKTDEGIAHKAALGGVHLRLADPASVCAAYESLARSLGPRVIVAPMISGVEVAIGVVAGQFGPTLMVAAGGTLIELLTDRCYLLCPVSPDEVRAAMGDLHLTRILRSSLGADSPAERSLYELASQVSVLATAFAGTIAELDINPVLVSDRGCMAVDALVGMVVYAENATDFGPE